MWLDTIVSELPKKAVLDSTSKPKKSMGLYMNLNSYVYLEKLTCLDRDEIFKTNPSHSTPMGQTKNNEMRGACT